MASPTSISLLPRQHKYVHEMTSTERLESLKEWAESKKWVLPGEGGTLPCGIIGGTKAMVYAGSASHSQSRDRFGGQYECPVGPPSYAAATGEELREKKTGALGKWMEKMRAKRNAERSGSVPPYAP
jgi:hypothetical protein